MARPLPAGPKPSANARAIPIEFLAKCSYYVLVALGPTERGLTERKSPAGRSLTSCIRPPRTAADRRRSRSPRGTAPLTSFTWARSSDSKIQVRIPDLCVTTLQGRAARARHPPQAGRAQRPLHRPDGVPAWHGVLRAISDPVGATPSAIVHRPIVPMWSPPARPVARHQGAHAGRRYTRVILRLAWGPSFKKGQPGPFVRTAGHHPFSGTSVPLW